MLYKKKTKKKTKNSNKKNFLQTLSKSSCIISKMSRKLQFLFVISSSCSSALCSKELLKGALVEFQRTVLWLHVYYVDIKKKGGNVFILAYPLGVRSYRYSTTL